MKHLTYLCDSSDRAYIIAHTKKKKIIYFNKVAKTLYHITDKTSSLEDIFQNCPMRLEEMIDDMVKNYADSHESVTFQDLYTVNEVGEEHIVDLVIGFLSALETEIFFEFTLKTGERERSVKDSKDNASEEKPPVSNEKPPVSSFLMGQLLATARLIEEDEKAAISPECRDLTLAETFFQEMIDRPASTLAQLESHLMPRREELEKTGKIQLIREMKLIYKVKNQYTISDDYPLDEEDFFKGYTQQMKKYYD